MNISKLKNIKSLEIIKKLFSYLDEEIKLKISKYNNCLKKAIDINLYNYKYFTGRYIEYETNNKGKEYNGYSGRLIYEGEFLNGKRNGKGKEYYDNDDGKLLFEGEYLNGKRNGKGKEYNYYGELIFEGKYLNGKRLTSKIYDMNANLCNDLKKVTGFIKEYNSDGILIFEGEYLNGERNGKGKEYNDDGKLLFEGEYLNGKRKGKG